MDWNPELNEFEAAFQSYANGEEIISNLRKHDYEKFLINELKELAYLIATKNLPQIPSTVPEILIRVNSRLREIGLPDKLSLEKVSSELFQNLIESLRQIEGGVDTIGDSINGLLVACQGHGYDFLELSSALGLEVFIEEIIVVVDQKNVDNAPYYDWRGKDYEIPELSNLLRKRELIYGTPAFKKLFAMPKEQFTFMANPQKLQELTVLFNILVQRKIIVPQRSQGKFHPLSYFGVDRFDQKLFTKEKQPKRHHEAAKLKIRRGSEICSEMDQIIKTTCSDSISALDGLTIYNSMNSNDLCVNLYCKPKKQTKK